MPPSHVYLRDNIAAKGNPFGAPAKARAEWAQGLNLPSNGECFFFAGCGYQFMDRAETWLKAVRGLEKRGLPVERVLGVSKTLKKVGVDLAGVYGKLAGSGKTTAYINALISAVNVLRKLGVNPAYLYDKEPCCGSPLYSSGFEEDFAENARRTYRLLKSLGVRKLISLVPACTHTLRNLYPRYVDGFDLEVRHFLEEVAGRLKNAGIQPALKEEMELTFHDPCQLARFLGITQEPREILSRVRNLRLREVTSTSRERTTCCGGGGGVEFTFPELSGMLAEERMKELLETKASVIATHCPACLLQLREARERMRAQVQVLDIAQVLDKALRGG